MLDYDTIEWERMAKPQDDGYDTEIYKQIVNEKYSWVSIDPPEDAVTWLDGKVELRKLDMVPGETYKQIDPLDKRFDFAAKLAATWPAQYEQFRQLINYTGAYESKIHSSPTSGCSCGPCRKESNPLFLTDVVTADEWGNVWSTMLSSTGFIEGIVHELGHWKAYALDIYIEDWGHTIFTNEVPSQEDIDNAPRYEDLTPEILNDALSRGFMRGPLRADKLRPIGAGYQAVYTCMHMLQYHLKIMPLVEEEFSNEPSINLWLDWARGHYIRTMKGHEDCLRIAELSEWGEKYWEGYVSWVDQLKADAKDLYAIV